MSLLSFNDDDVRLLRGLIHRERLRNRNRGTGPTPEDLPPSSDERYLIKLPSGGIDALDPTGTDPVAGKADCNVYIAVDDGSGDYELADTGYAIRVLNLGGPVGHAAWGVAGRDKYGVWCLVKAFAYDRCTAVMKGTGGSGSKTTCTVDNVAPINGPSPLDDPTDATEELTVYNKHGWDYDDNGAADIEYNHSYPRWEKYQVDCQV